MTAKSLPCARAASHLLAVLAMLWLGAATPLRAELNVYYPFKDFTAQAVSEADFEMTPIFRYTVDGSTNFIVADPRTFTTSTNGDYTVTNVLPGYAYRVKLYGYAATTFTNWFTNGLSGTVNGADAQYLAVPTNAVNDRTLAYSRAQSDARYPTFTAATNIALHIAQGVVSTSSVPGVITNNATGVTLSGTFSGNGSGLTNVSAFNPAFDSGTPQAVATVGISGQFTETRNLSYFYGTGDNMTPLPSANVQQTVALASNLFNFPKEIYIAAGVYGMAYRMTPTNSGVNSGGQFYISNPYYGNGSLWSEYASNVLSSDYGITVNVDSSMSISSYGSEPTELAAGTAQAAMPPWDRQTPTLYWLKQRSPNATGTNKLIYLHAPQAGIESATYTGAAAFQAVTNLAVQLEADGWTVALGTFIFNTHYWASYTNQTATGIHGSNYDAAVRGVSSRWPIVDFFKVTTNWAAYNSLNSDTNYYCGGNHIGYWTGQVLGTNFVRTLITNSLVTSAKRFTPYNNSDTKAGWVMWFAGNSFIPTYTNERPVFNVVTNSAIVGGPQTNGYSSVNMTVSNLLPNTRYEWQAGFHFQTSAKGGRWDFRTDKPTKQYDFAGRVIYHTASDIVGNSISGSGTANNTVVGGIRSIGAANDNCGALIAGAFTTGTNLTALQMYYAPEVTNAANVNKAGFLRVWPSLAQ